MRLLGDLGSCATCVATTREPKLILPFLAALNSTDIAHLNSTQPPQPAPTSGGIRNLCENFKCENDGICIVQDNKAVCRCPSGPDWWYMGDRCEKKGSTRDTVVIAVSSTVTVFAVMLVITLVSVYCIKKKYSKQSSTTADMTMENVSGD
ncbi:Meprin A subunit beta [Galemys pyrenaicus]|uniref:Meprin A subunit beta n=1 Tax=Galemys pyrenaicus TaxID=202257 RepID=A0A8J6A6R9_GALPY|nr:Meprin A subunit beta [Galemys pyrenaicus]